MSFSLLLFIILVALTFDFLNGFHDAANSIATVVSTRVLSPQKAVLWAAFFNFIAAFVMGTAVAKTMGIITGLLVTGGYLKTFEVPLWVILISHAAIALGTMFGGWRIVKTMGTKITKLQPFGGFCAETSGAITLFLATRLGIPVSTTHTITGAIIGVGATRRISAVKWGVAGKIVWAWVLTIPLSAAVSAISYFVIRAFS